MSSASTATIGVLETGAGEGVTVGWARTMLLSALGESCDIGIPSSSSVMTFLAGVTGSGTSIEISDKSNSGKADATYLRQSSNPVLQ